MHMNRSNSASGCGCRACNDELLAKEMVSTLRRKTQQLTYKQSHSECLRLSKELAVTRKKVDEAREKLKEAASQLEKKRREYGGIMRRDLYLALAQLALDLTGAGFGRKLARAVLMRRVEEISDRIGPFANFEAWRKEYNKELPEKVRRFLQEYTIKYESALAKVEAELNNEDRLKAHMVRLDCSVGFFVSPD